MESLVWKFILFIGFVCAVYSKIIEIRVARELEECFEQRRFHSNLTDPRYDNIHGYCIQKYRWHLQKHYWQNITEETSNWIDELLRISSKQARRKRQTLNVRREYRRLTDQERSDFHRAINMLKQDTSVKPNRFDALGLLHQKLGDDVHHGAGFLGFHRVLLVVYENALRQKIPTVNLPYWDSRLDQPLRDATRSIIWSPQFMGTIKGRVVNGPFAFWQTPAGPLVRNGGQEGELFTYSHIRAVMTRSHLSEISEPHALPPYDFEIRHGDVHQHVGGLMAPAETAGFDPVFFMHHCFVDYLWEVFRRSQKEKGVDPTKDYPSRFGTTAHGPKHKMGLGRLLNEHGLSDMFTSRLYTYEPSPTCSFGRPSCGSNYLTCEFRFGRPQCVTLEMLSTTPQQPVNSNIPQQWRQFTPQLQTGIPRSPMPNQFRSALANRQRQQQLLLQQQQQQQANNLQNRGRQQRGNIQNRAQSFNQFGHGRFGRSKRQAPNQEGHAIDGGRLAQLGQNVLSQFGGNQLSEFIRNKTNTASENSQSVQTAAPDTDIFKVMKDGTNDLIVSPVTNICPSTSPQNVIQNLFQLNGISDSRVWVWIPIRVVYKRQPEQMKFDNFPVEAGSMLSGKDIYDPTQYKGLSKHFEYKFNHPRTCRDMDGIYTKIMIHSDGLNYHGTFREFALVDARQPFATSVVYIAIKSPEKWNTEALLSGYDPCGNVCKPYCRRNNGFVPCDGALRLTNESKKGPNAKSPTNYGMDYGEATKMVWDISSSGIPTFNDGLIFMQFVCN